jgi:hypothetical protein
LDQSLNNIIGSSSSFHSLDAKKKIQKVAELGGLCNLQSQNPREVLYQLSRRLLNRREAKKTGDLWSLSWK